MELRDELLNGEMFYTLQEARVVIESWRRHYNRVRPHASLGYRAPAPEVVVSAMAGRPLGQLGGLWPIRGVLSRGRLRKRAKKHSKRQRPSIRSLLTLPSHPRISLLCRESLRYTPTTTILAQNLPDNPANIFLREKGLGKRFSD